MMTMHLFTVIKIIKGGCFNFCLKIYTDIFYILIKPYFLSNTFRPRTLLISKDLISKEFDIHKISKMVKLTDKILKYEDCCHNKH